MAVGQVATINPEGALIFSELEWRNYVLLANASKALITLRKKSHLAFRHYQALGILKSIVSGMAEVGTLLHSREAVSALERATADQLLAMAEKMRDIHTKNTEIVAQIRTLDLGFWGPVYHPYVLKLESCSSEMDSHIRAFTQSESANILLTKRDQDHLLGTLLNPPEPNEALRRAFGLK